MEKMVEKAILTDQSVLSTTQEENDTVRNNSSDKTALSSTSIGAHDLYKMKARGRKGKKSPTRIEFQRIKSTKALKKNSIFDALRKPSNDMRQKNYLNTNGNADVLKSNSNGKNEDDNREHIEVYYFDHGNCAYFRTTDCYPTIVSEKFVNQSSECATKFWAEVYGSLHIGIAFVVAFIIQTYRFLLYSTIRPIIIGLIQITADYFTKPLLAIVFNGILQPILILFYNISTSICDMVEPIAKAFGHLMQPITNLFRAIRLVEVRNYESRKMSEDTVWEETV